MIKHKNSFKLCMVGHKTFPMLAIRQVRHFMEFINKGIAVDVIALRFKKEPLIGNYMGSVIKRIKLNKDRSSRFRYIYCYMRSIINMSILTSLNYFKKKYDIIYIFTLPDAMLFAGLLPKLFGAKIIADHLDPMPELFVTKYNFCFSKVIHFIIKILEKISLRIADHIITQNHSYAELLIKRGINADKITVIHNLPDSSIWGPLRSPYEINLSKNLVRLMFHGNITERSGLHIAVKAVSLLKKRNINIIFRIVGTGDYENEVLSLIRELGIEDRIEWKGVVFSSQIPDLISDIDIGIVPNLASPFADVNLPNRVFEYLWMGKPVILSENAGIQRYFPRTSVFYSEPGNPIDIANVICKILNTENRNMKNIVSNGQKICKELDWDKERQKFYKLLYSLMGL